MATLPTLLSQYGILKTLTTHIWASDLENLACTSRDLHANIRGSRKVHAALRKSTLACDGVSGRVWKEEWLANPERKFETRGRHMFERVRVSLQSDWLAGAFAGEEEKEVVMRRCRQVLLGEMRCKGETEGGEGARPCVVCREPVCENCRFRSTIYAVTRTSQGFAISPSFAGNYMDKFAARWDAFCRACVEVSRKVRPDGRNEKLVACSCPALEDGEEAWMCAPCFKTQRADRRHPISVCEERVPTTKGCFGLTRWLRKCRWCEGFIEQNGSFVFNY